MPLTPKDELFARASFSGKSNREAAIAAGCPEGTASAAGSRFARKPEVIEFIKHLQQAEEQAAKEVSLEEKPQSNTNLKLLKPMPNRDDSEGGGENVPSHLSPMLPPNDRSSEGVASESNQQEQELDSLAYLRMVLNDRHAPMKYRLDAARELAKYEHAKVAPQGKKDAELAAANVIAGNRYRPMSPPNPQTSIFTESEAPIPVPRTVTKGYIQ